VGPRDEDDRQEPEDVARHAEAPDEAPARASRKAGRRRRRTRGANGNSREEEHARDDKQAREDENDGREPREAETPPSRGPASESDAEGNAHESKKKRRREARLAA
jgi:hypothetical protein